MEINSRSSKVNNNSKFLKLWKLDTVSIKFIKNKCFEILEDFLICFFDTVFSNIF